jgi:hypothetical protein
MLAINATVLQILSHVMHAEILLAVSNAVHYEYAKRQHNMATLLLNYHPRKHLLNYTVLPKKCKFAILVHRLLLEM